MHAYLVPGADGWIVVDTGLGLPDASERWAAELAQLPGDARVATIMITHFHPDHVGAAADVAALTAAEVVQGALDLDQCRRVWGADDWADVLATWFHRHGAPDEVTHELIEQGSFWRPFIRFVPDATPVEPGDRVDGWELVAAPGHADGQLVLLRDGILLGADHVLDPITPTVGLWPASRPDPLGDYLDALRALIELEPTVALPGHGEPIADPVGRAHALIRHHDERLEATLAALRPDDGRSAFDLSYTLFGANLKPAGRRFAIAETLSHLERLVLAGAARRTETTADVSYTAA